MSKWQLIETAPRDGKEVLLAFAFDRKAPVVSQGWFSNNADFPEMWVLGSAWMQTMARLAFDLSEPPPGTMGVGIPTDSAFAPTHWMPLPPPPTIK
jgi:hypothetical protein